MNEDEARLSDAAQRFQDFLRGRGYAHRVIEDGPFRQGEVRCLIQENQLDRNGLRKEGKLPFIPFKLFGCLRVGNT